MKLTEVLQSDRRKMQEAQELALWLEQNENRILDILSKEMGLTEEQETAIEIALCLGRERQWHYAEKHANDALAIKEAVNGQSA